jgi:dolichol-phosphate mannosyltransferase
MASVQLHFESPAEVKLAGSPATLVSVVIPCFNESQGLHQLKARLNDLLEVGQSDYLFQFVLVDDGSSDDTYRILGDLFADDERFLIVRHPKNQGLSSAILTGIHAAGGEWVVSLDADCTYDPLQIFQLLEKIQPSTTMVMGSPYHRSGKVLQVPAWRIAISKTANRIYRMLMKTKLTCYTGCFRAIRKSVAERIQLENPGFVGMTEMVWRVEQFGGRIEEVPVVLDVRRYGQSKLRLLRVVGQHLRLMLKVALKHR